ncbi:type VII secretion target [Glycomyces tenuis]|uniref:type VII secretion target n=1 Tax=Glycomyces tenuis TaxID=58116 RepID=UPI000429D8FE|nr:type VII secretion target [Glycomyces tenuis]
MAEGYTVESEELLEHAATLESLAARFDAIEEASTHIVQDDEAYGFYCLWMSLIMANRHLAQDQLVARVRENLTLAAGELRAAAAAYDDTDKATQQEMQGLFAEQEA